jgi:hypothetical protein
LSGGYIKEKVFKLEKEVKSEKEARYINLLKGSPRDIVIDT